MANKSFINQMKRLQSTVNNVTPAVYAGIALALYEKGWRYQRINDLFVRSQEIWTDSVENGDDMTKHCLDVTGIDVRRKIEER